MRVLKQGAQGSTEVRMVNRSAITRFLRRYPADAIRSPIVFKVLGGCVRTADFINAYTV